MRKISKLLVLAAASSALFSGSAMAGGAPATLGGSSSFTGGQYNAVPVVVAPVFIQVQQILGQNEVVAILGPFPTNSSELLAYLQNIQTTTDATVFSIVRESLQNLRNNIE